MKRTSFSPLTRRAFTKLSVAGTLGAGFTAAFPFVSRAASATRRLRIACVGAAGKGWDDMIGVSEDGERHDIVAICDIDHRDGGEQPANLKAVQLARPLGIGAARRQFPQAKVYQDFRRLLEQRDIDAITVSTPDHMHATVALSAMTLGKHVFVQKPLAQTVHEARVMREVAAARRVVTQMGNQNHSGAGYRCAVQVIQSGVIGKVRAAYSWATAPAVWPANVATLASDEPAPASVNWDLWIGVAQPRPYRQHTYHNFNWRAWKEYGTGMLGDIGCHVMDPVVWGLELTGPRTVQATVSEFHPEIYSAWNVVNYEFAATRFAAEGFRYTWSDGRKPPVDPAHVPAGVTLPASASLLIGEKGTMIASPGAAPRLYPQASFQDYSLTTLKEMFASFAAEKRDHYRMWTDAILAGKQANSSFESAGPLTEIVMLGTIAQRLPDQVLRWNAKALTFDNPAATALVRRHYRQGWEIPTLA
jgi:predicted dehydrogenase